MKDEIKVVNHRKLKIKKLIKYFQDIINKSKDDLLSSDPVVVEKTAEQLQESSADIKSDIKACESDRKKLRSKLWVGFLGAVASIAVSALIFSIVSGSLILGPFVFGAGALSLASIISFSVVPFFRAIGKSRRIKKLNPLDKEIDELYKAATKQNENTVTLVDNDMNARIKNLENKQLNENVLAPELVETENLKIAKQDQQPTNVNTTNANSQPVQSPAYAHSAPVENAQYAEVTQTQVEDVRPQFANKDVSSQYTTETVDGSPVALDKEQLRKIAESTMNLESFEVDEYNSEDSIQNKNYFVFKVDFKILNSKKKGPHKISFVNIKEKSVDAFVEKLKKVNLEGNKAETLRELTALVKDDMKVVMNIYSTKPSSPSETFTSKDYKNEKTFFKLLENLKTNLVTKLDTKNNIDEKTM